MSEQNTPMEGQTITTTAPKAVEEGKKPGGWSITIPDPFIAESLEELAAKYGEETILTAAQQQLRVKAQAAIRSMAQAGKPDEEIVSTMETWKPGDKLGLGGDPMANIMKNFGNLSPEQRDEVMRKLAAQVNG